MLKYAITSGELRDAVSQLSPDIAIVSAHLSQEPYSGFMVLRQMQSPSRKTRFIMLMDQLEGELVVDAFRAGARGVFKKSAPVSLLYKCITAVHNGQIWASNDELQYLLKAVQSTMPLKCLNARGESLLSPREEQIVPLVAAGLTNKEISDRLRLSEHTVKNHLFRIYDRLGISSRVELILYAVTQKNRAA
jgi:DNA-binding NarL/FixJ family response regulator